MVMIIEKMRLKKENLDGLGVEEVKETFHKDRPTLWNALSKVLIAFRCILLRFMMVWQTFIDYIKQLKAACVQQLNVI